MSSAFGLDSPAVAHMGTAPAADPLQVGWTALRDFFRQGRGALTRAIELLRSAEAGVRRSGAPTRMTLWLLALATALRYTRNPESMDEALERARELVNLVARAQDEAATIPYRTVVEGIYCDHADVVPAQAVASVAAGLQYSDRTVRLARRVGRDDWLAAALASRGDLMLRHAGTDRRGIRRALTLHEEARRRWPARDHAGRAQAGLGYAAALLAAGEASKAELVARESLAAFAGCGDRYHEAGAHLMLARVLLALQRDDALDEQAAAASLFKILGCRWELGQAERVLA